MKLGELFAGYGGLGMGVQQVWPEAELAWYSDVCKFDKDGNAGHYEPHRGPCAIMAHHHPDVPNLGDVTKVDWAQVEPVDILTGGSPCQDLSHAGKRAGMTEGTRSNLWVAMREAIAQLRPSIVVWENVRGAYSAAADSEVEPCAGCVGDGPGVHLRALGRVLGDLSDLGYDARWHGIRAADVGAPHGRFRVFIVANAKHDGSSVREIGRGSGSSEVQRRLLQPQGPSAHPTLLSTPQARDGKGVPGDGFNQANLARDVSLLPTPRSRDAQPEGVEAGLARMERYSTASLPTVATLLPTPAVNDMGASYTPETWDAWTERMKAEHEGAEVQDSWSRQWGDYADAIARWEALTRPAPAPTQPSKKGTPQLSAAFSEWLMGLPAGHVTDVPGITRNEALKALGNGVVPQQAAEALRVMLAWKAAA